MKRIVFLAIVVVVFISPKQVKQLWNTTVSLTKQSVSLRNTRETGETNSANFENKNSVQELLRYASAYQGRDHITFFDSLFAMSKRLQLQPFWVLKTMFHESALNPKAQNSIGAAGLIQFKSETAVSLGTSTSALLKMSGTEQLPYIEKFWMPIAGQANSYADLRLYNLFPAAFQRSNDFILESAQLPANVVAARNPMFDTNGDMKITVKEFKDVVSNE